MKPLAARNDTASDADNYRPAIGTDYYYASLYYPPEQRHRIQILEALRRELTRIPASCSDRGVAHTKLAWWRDEIERTKRDEPRHQLAREIRPLMVADNALADVLIELINGVDRSLSEAVLATRDAVVSYIYALHHGILKTIAATGSALGSDDCAALRRLTSLTELAYELRGLRQHRLGGTLYISAAALSAHGLNVDRIRHTLSSDPLRPLLEAEMRATRDELQATLADMPRTVRRQQRVFTTLARIQLHALQLTLDDGCHVLERRIELTPVHKLWIAFRTHRFG